MECCLLVCEIKWAQHSLKYRQRNSNDRVLFTFEKELILMSIRFKAGVLSLTVYCHAEARGILRETCGMIPRSSV
jgi:hypothetical protein